MLVHEFFEVLKEDDATTIIFRPYNSDAVLARLNRLELQDSDCVARNIKDCRDELCDFDLVPVKAIFQKDDLLATPIKYVEPRSKHTLNVLLDVPVVELWKVSRFDAEGRICKKQIFAPKTILKEVEITSVNRDSAGVIVSISYTPYGSAGVKEITEGVDEFFNNYRLV